MEEKQMEEDHDLSGNEYIAPWERAFYRVILPIEEFIHRQKTSGILLMLCTAIALGIANSPLFHSWHEFFMLSFTIGLEDFHLSKSLHHWINDGLMALFFLVVGLELKREILVGELANLKQALLPIIAASGGMLMPAVIYLVINPSGHAVNGWGVPMATDIAFALGVLALLGDRIPKNLLMFLVALAIVDDLGAVIVIALFYTDSLNTTALLLSCGAIFVLIFLNLGGVRTLLPYMITGLFLWTAMLQSGIHATLAGVILAFMVPMKPKYDPDRFFFQIQQGIKNIKTAFNENSNILINDTLRSRVRALANGVSRVQAPAQTLELKLHLVSAYIVIPVFALANAGVPIDFHNISALLIHPVAVGIGAGLVFGKLIGIAGFTWVAVRIGVSRLPEGVSMNHIIGAALMGGIGFTMSIFIAELGFAGYPEDLLMAKTGILLASLTAGMAGFSWLYIGSKKEEKSIEAGS